MERHPCRDHGREGKKEAFLFDKPLYLRGFQPSRRRRYEAVGAGLFVALIATVNYLVFFRSNDLIEPSLDQRLALTVEVPEVAASETPVSRASEPLRPETTRVEEGVVMRGETATQTLLRLGASSGSAASALNALGERVNLRALRVGQKVVLELGSDGTITRLTFPLDVTNYLEVTRGDGGYKCTRKEIETQKELVQFACMIRGSLYASLERCGVDRDLAPVLVDLLEGQVDFFTDSRRGDVIRVAVERESLDGKFLRYGRVRGLLYEGKVVTASAFPIEVNGNVEYYDADGRSVERPFRRSPLKYTRISSDFSLRRLHPILHAYTPHRAVDYAAPRGTPVHAVGDGRVVFKGPKGAAGRMVVLQHEGGWQTYYAHLDKFAKGLKVGDTVAKGTFLGNVGSSGRATGPHLHFAVARQGRFVHLRSLLTSAGQPISRELEPEFKTGVARVVGELKALSIRGVDGSRS